MYNYIYIHTSLAEYDSYTGKMPFVNNTPRATSRRC